MRVLALEPFYGGSHRAFLNGWQRHSSHEFTVLGLPAYKWKWRMRHAAITFAAQLNQPPYQAQAWEVIWCSDMLNLPEFIGLAPRALRELPKVVYFHENQLTYPVRQESERDLHFAFTNFSSCLAADRIWFNSDFHRSDLLGALHTYLQRMPDYEPLRELALIEPKCEVQYPGISPFPPRSSRINEDGPLRICWNARWEHDKNPELFLAALRLLKQAGTSFRLIVLGDTFTGRSESCAAAKTEFVEDTEHWGFVESVAEYRSLLTSADVIVSTADHEFFGIGILEGIAAGLLPLVPNRLAYPEVIDQLARSEAFEPFYDGTAKGLFGALQKLTVTIRSREMREEIHVFQNRAAAFDWQTRAAQMDERLESTASC